MKDSREEWYEENLKMAVTVADVTGVAGVLAAVFGGFIIVSALTMFPSESSWGSTS